MTTPEDLPVAFRPRDRAGYLPAADALVVADLHLGKGEAAAVELPITGRIVERVDGLVDWFEPATVVVAGDVLHSFSRVSPAVADAFDDLRAGLVARGVDLRVVAGNHDVGLDSLREAEHEPGEGEDGRDEGGNGGDDAGDGATAAPAEAATGSDNEADAAEPPEACTLRDGTVVCHGHEEPAERADRYVVGHDHPAIVIEGRRRPCYLLGEGVYRGADVLALPAFNPLATGTAVNRLDPGDPSSPLLGDVRAFRPVVWDGEAEETYVFPPLGASRAFL